MTVTVKATEVNALMFVIAGGTTPLTAVSTGVTPTASPQATTTATGCVDAIAGDICPNWIMNGLINCNSVDGQKNCPLSCNACP